MKLNQTSFLMTVGVSASVIPVVTGTATSFSVSPALPTGLILNPVTAQIDGIPTASAALTTYTLTTHDSSGAAVTTSFQLTVYVAPTLSVVGSPFTFIQGTVISSITPVISSSVYQVSISPALPTGLTSVTSSGVISGTPTATSGATTYTLTASNPAGATASTTISITVTAASAAITYAGSPYIFTTADVVNVTPSLSIGTITVSPALTNGLSMDTSGHITGTVTGTLAQTTYTLTATSGVTATTNLTIQIVAPPVIAYTGSPFTLTKSTLASITPSTLTSVATTSVSPALPGTLALSGTNGNITGTPNTTAANATYTVTATNLAGRSVTTTIDLKINDVAPAITYTGSPFVYSTGDVVSLTPATLSGSISISPALSHGLGISSSTGVIAGTTTTTLAATPYTVTATNSTGQTATASISIQIVALPLISYAGSPYVLNTGDVVSISPATSSGLITISPAMTNSLSISGTGTISGTATGNITSTTYTITATNAAGAAVNTTLVIGPNNPIKLVQTAAANNDGTGVITLPGASTTGDLMVLNAWVSVTQVSDLNGITASDSFGNSYALATSNSYVDTDNGGFTASVILYAKNITVSNSTPITITLSLPSLGSDSAYGEETASEFSGVDVTSPLDQIANSTGSGGASPFSVASGVTGSTTQAYELLVSNVAIGNNTFMDETVVQTNSPKFTFLAGLTNSSASVAGQALYAIVSSTGTYSATLSAANPNGQAYSGFAGSIASFKGAQTSSGVAPATKIVLATSSQSKKTHACSAIVSVVSKTTADVVANVSSDQTVTLSGSGLQFYSDSTCTLPISTLTFSASASTTQSFYFAASTPGSITLSLTPTSFTTLTQVETITLASRTWLGTGGTANWSTAANWSGGSVPASGQTAIFDSNCTSCNATMDSVTSGTNLITYPNYTGTITNTAATVQMNTTTLGGGTFNLGSGNYISGFNFILSSPAVMNAQTSTFTISNGQSLTAIGTSATFNHLHFTDTTTGPYNSISFFGNFYVNGNLTLDNITTSSTDNVNLVAGYTSQYSNIYVAGNVTANSSGGGSAIIILNGNNNTQTVTGAAAGILPKFTIAHTGTGGVTFAGTIVVDQDFTLTSGTISPGTSTLQLGRGDATWDGQGTILAAYSPLNVYNLVFNKQSGGGVSVDQGTFNVANNFTISNAVGVTAVAAGCGVPVTFNLGGNMDAGVAGMSKYCNTGFNFIGTNTQTLTSSGGAFNPGDIAINKTGGSVSLTANITTGNSGLTLQQGTLNLSTYSFNISYGLVLQASSILNCNGGCGGTPGLPSPPAALPNACGLGLGHLQCGYIDNAHGGVINP